MQGEEKGCRVVYSTLRNIHGHLEIQSDIKLHSYGPGEEKH